MKEKDNIIYFDDDFEFEQFAVVPMLYPKNYTRSDGTPDQYADFDLSNDYKDCLKDGKEFCIMDKNSKIYKRGCVNYRTISKKIDNLRPYRGEDV